MDRQTDGRRASSLVPTAQRLVGAAKWGEDTHLLARPTSSHLWRLAGRGALWAWGPPGLSVRPPAV